MVEAEHVPELVGDDEGHRVAVLAAADSDLRAREASVHTLDVGVAGDLEPADALTADRIYERRWALTLLDQVFARLGEEYRKAGNAALFDQLKQLLTGEPEERSQAEIAQELSTTENAVTQAFHRLRKRYRQLVREEIAHTVAMPGDVDDELRHFIAVLQM